MVHPIRDTVSSISKNILLIYRGFSDQDRIFQAESGITAIRESIQQIRINLIQIFGDKMPPEFTNTLRIIDYVILRINYWYTNKSFFGNPDVEIFIEAAEKQVKDLDIYLNEYLPR